LDQQDSVEHDEFWEIEKSQAQINSTGCPVLF
jgi:hypothetical protein